MATREEVADVLEELARGIRVGDPSEVFAVGMKIGASVRAELIGDVPGQSKGMPVRLLAQGLMGTVLTLLERTENGSEAPICLSPPVSSWENLAARAEDLLYDVIEDAGNTPGGLEAYVLHTGMKLVQMCGANFGGSAGGGSIGGDPFGTLLGGAPFKGEQN